MRATRCFCPKLDFKRLELSARYLENTTMTALHFNFAEAAAALKAQDAVVAEAVADLNKARKQFRDDAEDFLLKASCLSDPAFAEGLLERDHAGRGAAILQFIQVLQGARAIVTGCLSEMDAALKPVTASGAPNRAARRAFKKPGK